MTVIPALTENKQIRVIAALNYYAAAAAAAAVESSVVFLKFASLQNQVGNHKLNL